MRRISFALLLLLVLRLPLGAGEITVKRRDIKDEKRGPRFSRLQVTVDFPNGRFEYGCLKRKNLPETVIKKWGDHSFGLSFGRTGNGGWNVWKFLKATVRVGDQHFDGTARYPLDGVYVLETGKRAMADFIWSLTPEEADPDTPRLALRVLQVPSHADWLFLQLSLEGEAALEQVELSCYPCNTTGKNYKIRERWVTTPSGSHNLHQGKAVLPVADGGMVLHNKHAQQRYGCLLVFCPDEIEAVEAAGTYGVAARFTPKPKVRVLRFALGYFKDTPWQTTARQFEVERRDQILHFLTHVDWTPQVALEKEERIMAEIETLLAKRRTSFWPELGAAPPPRDDLTEAPPLEARFAQQKAAYIRARNAKDVRSAMQILAALKSIKEQLLCQALDELR